jgi:hypothetical protein
MITMMLHYSKPPLTSAKLLSREKSKQEEQWLEDVTAPLVALGVASPNFLVSPVFSV